MAEQMQRVTKHMTYPKFQPPTRVLLGAGPSPVDARIYEAMGRPVLGHLDPMFLKCMDEIKDMMRQVFETKNAMTIPISGTGSAGMEASLANVIEPGDDVVVGVIGYFGERMLDMAERIGGNVTTVRANWGEPLDRGHIQEALKSCKPKVLALVHAETSTGVLQDLAGLADMAHKAGALLVTDAVTSLGTHPVSVDRNEIDVCFSGTQKGIGAPPGLAPVTFSDRAMTKIRARKRRVQSWYFDVTTIEGYWGADRAYHHTAPISMNYALHEALRGVLEEGLEERWARHELNHRALLAGIETMGLRLRVAPEHRLWALNPIQVPDGIDEGKVRAHLLAEHNIEISGGLGPLKGQIWRVGLMGSGSTRHNVGQFLTAFREALGRQGLDCPSGVEAAEQVYADR